jgi:hypothetical protein
MYLLDIGPEEMQQWYDEFKTDNYKSEKKNENKQ